MGGFQCAEKKELIAWPSPEVGIKLVERYMECEHHLTLLPIILESDYLEAFIIYLSYLNLLSFEFPLPLSFAQFWIASPVRFSESTISNLQLLVQVLDSHSFFCLHVGRRRWSYMKNVYKREYKQTHSLWSARIVSYHHLCLQ